MVKNIKDIIKVTSGHIEVYIGKVKLWMIAGLTAIEWNMDLYIDWYEGIGRVIVMSCLIIGAVIKLALIIKEYKNKIKK